MLMGILVKYVSFYFELVWARSWLMPRHCDREAQIINSELKGDSMVQGRLVSTSVAYAEALHPRSRDLACK